jgi:hypothetical protein
MQKEWHLRLDSRLSETTAGGGKGMRVVWEEGVERAFNMAKAKLAPHSK